MAMQAGQLNVAFPVTEGTHTSLMLSLARLCSTGRFGLGEAEQARGRYMMMAMIPPLVTRSIIRGWSGLSNIYQVRCEDKSGLLSSCKEKVLPLTVS